MSDVIDKEGHAAGESASAGSGSVDTDWRAVLEPTQPHDALSFEELSKRYNFQKTSDRSRLFVRLILKELEGRAGTVRVLDIGAGKGISQSLVLQRAVADNCDELWGVEPDEGIKRTDGIFTNYQHALMETAELPENAFDVAYAFLVMEHVADPDAFLRALHRCLKPGGVFIFMTPNKKHYFAIITSLLKAMKVEELTLRLLRGKSMVEEYHYPVTYRFNCPNQIDPTAKRVGMDRPQYAYVEEEGPRPYMKGPLILMFHLLKLKRQILKNPRVLLDLTGRLAKPISEE